MSKPPSNEPNEAIAQAMADLALTPEERWRQELSSEDPNQRAGAELALGRLAAAEADFAAAIELLGRAANSGVPAIAPRANVHLVPILEELGDRAEAEKALHEAQANSDPEHTADVSLDVAAILVSRGHSERAIQVLRSVVDAWRPQQERATDDGAGLARAVAALRLGNLLAERGGVASAIPYWQLAMSANYPAVTPGAALLLANAFVAEYLAGAGRQPAEIEELYRIAVDFDHPEASPEAALRLAEFYLEQEQPRLAAEWYQSLIPIGGDVGNRARVGLDKAGAASGSGQGMQAMLRRAASLPRSIKRQRVLIVGAGTGGKYLLRDLDKERYEAVGWIDDAQKGSRIGGLRVVGTIDDLPKILNDTRLPIKAVFIAIPTMSGARRRQVVEAAMEAGVEVKNLPSMFELLRGRNIARQLRDVRVEETLGEQPVTIDREAGAVVRGRSVMIVGAGSTIGTELSRQVAHARGRYVSLVASSTTALRRVSDELQRDRDFEHAFPVLAAFHRPSTMRMAITAHSPEVVFHVAGHSNAPIVEEHPVEAMRTDVIGTLDLARLCGEAGVNRFVLVSSEAAAEPRGIFSASKVLAERALAVVAKEFPETDFVAVRVGSLYRSSGSVLEVFDRQIETGGPLTLTDERATRRFMRVEQATQLLLRTAGIASPGGLYALKGEEGVAVKDVAEWMIRLREYKPDDIEIKVTGPRPLERSLGNPYNNRERPIPTDVPEVLQIEPPHIPVKDVRAALDAIRQAIEVGDSAKLRNLVEGQVRGLLDSKQDVERPDTEEIGLAIA